MAILKGAQDGRMATVLSPQNCELLNAMAINRSSLGYYLLPSCISNYHARCDMNHEKHSGSDQAHPAAAN